METKGNNGTVLVVEDEALLNWDVSAVLREDGFEALQAYSAEEALKILSGRNSVRVLFTDINLPGKDGIELAAEVSARWPQIEVLMTSGRHLGLETHPLVGVYGRFVPKPYPPKAVARRIHEIIDSRAA